LDLTTENAESPRCVPFLHPGGIEVKALARARLPSSFGDAQAEDLTTNSTNHTNEDGRPFVLFVGFVVANVLAKGCVRARSPQIWRTEPRRPRSAGQVVRLESGHLLAILVEIPPSST
jgi:hypothetical protein